MAKAISSKRLSESLLRRLTISGMLYLGILCGFLAVQNTFEYPGTRASRNTSCFTQVDVRPHRIPEVFHFWNENLMIVPLSWIIASIHEATWIDLHIRQIWPPVTFELCVGGKGEDTWKTRCSAISWKWLPNWNSTSLLYVRAFRL